MNVTAEWLARQARLLRGVSDADALGRELGCEVTPHPDLVGRVEAWHPLPGLHVMVGTPGEVRDGVREHGLLLWLAVLGKQGRT